MRGRGREDDRGREPAFFALGQKTLARFVSCGVAVTRTRWKVSLRCALAELGFCVFGFLLSGFFPGGRRRGLVWPWLSPDAEEGLVAARGLVALLVKVVMVV